MWTKIVAPLSFLVALAAAPACGGAADADADADADAESDGGSGLEPGECRGDEDCTEPSAESCVQPGAWTPCGVPCNAPRECEPEAGCAGDLVCEEHVGDCCSPAEPLASRCVERCSESSCGAGERCLGSGLCEALPCDEGYDCPAHTSCEGGAEADEHGCVRARCVGDPDCMPTGFCVVGACFETPGSCRGPGA